MIGRRRNNVTERAAKVKKMMGKDVTNLMQSHLSGAGVGKSDVDIWKNHVHDLEDNGSVGDQEVSSKSARDGKMVTCLEHSVCQSANVCRRIGMKGRKELKNSGYLDRLATFLLVKLTFPLDS